MTGSALGAVLAPLAGTRARAADDEVRAMPVVIRLERTAPPARTAVLEAAATAALAVCLDPRSAPGGEWHADVSAWVAGRIRKVARRARGAHWDAVAALPGVTVEVGGAQVRALVPGLVSATPREVGRLQVGGTDLPMDTPGAPPAGVPVVWLSPTVRLTVGKAAAQVGHATMLLAAALPADRLSRWHGGGLGCAVRVATAARWREVSGLAGRDADRAAERGNAGPDGRGYAVAVRDAGFTEVAPGTVTCVAQWPAAG